MVAALAPHKHLNSLEDLLLDGRSDSGMIVDGGSGGHGLEFGAARLLDDDPCLACFPNDYAASDVGFFVLAGSSRSLPWNPCPPRSSPRKAIPELAASRSPPENA